MAYRTGRASLDTEWSPGGRHQSSWGKVRGLSGIRHRLYLTVSMTEDGYLLRGVASLRERGDEAMGGFLTEGLEPCDVWEFSCLSSLF